jgi:hypothetical protein
MSEHFAEEGLPERFRFSGLHLPKDLPVSLPSEVVRQRSDVRAAKANLHAATAHVGVAIAGRRELYCRTWQAYPPHFGNFGPGGERFASPV